MADANTLERDRVQPVNLGQSPNSTPEDIETGAQAANAQLAAIQAKRAQEDTAAAADARARLAALQGEHVNRLDPTAIEPMESFQNGPQRAQKIERSRSPKERNGVAKNGVSGARVTGSLAGTTLQGTGLAMQGVGKGANVAGKGMQRAGAALSATGIGAVIGVPLAVAGTGVSVGGKVVDKSGKVVRKTGKMVKRAARRQKKATAPSNNQGYSSVKTPDEQFRSDQAERAQLQHNDRKRGIVGAHAMQRLNPLSRTRGKIRQKVGAVGTANGVVGTVKNVKEKTVAVTAMFSFVPWVLWVIGMIGLALQIIGFVGRDLVDGSFWGAGGVVADGAEYVGLVDVDGMTATMFIMGWAINIVVGLITMGFIYMYFAFGTVFSATKGSRFLYFSGTFLGYTMPFVNALPWFLLWLFGVFWASKNKK